jgi:hypothetical protein
MSRDIIPARDVIQIADPILTDELLEEKRQEFTLAIEEISRYYRKILQCRQKLQAIPRSMKPKQYRRQLWELGRLVIRTSRLMRAVKIQSPVVRHLIERIRTAVDELKPLEREVTRIQATTTGGGFRGIGRRTAPHARNHHPVAPGGRGGQARTDRSQPPAGGEHRQAVHQPRSAIPRPDPGRQHRPDEGRG